jgi:hypothetical protein
VARIAAENATHSAASAHNDKRFAGLLLLLIKFLNLSHVVHNDQRRSRR